MVPAAGYFTWKALSHISITTSTALNLIPASYTCIRDGLYLTVVLNKPSGGAWL